MPRGGGRWHGRRPSGLGSPRRRNGAPSEEVGPRVLHTARGGRAHFHSPAAVPSRPHSQRRPALLSPAPKLHFRYAGAGRKRAGIGPIPRLASVAKQHWFWPRPPGARNLSPRGSRAAPRACAWESSAAGACGHRHPELALSVRWV